MDGTECWKSCVIYHAYVRSFFDTEALDLFANRKGISVDAIPGLFTYREGGRKKPEEIRQLMTEAYAFYKALSQQIS